LVLDCRRIRAQYNRLAAALPGVDLHYAIKALSHPAVLAALNSEGSSFDISSPGELALVTSLGVSPSRLINTHPIKSDRDILDSLQYGCNTFVVDNAFEMDKFIHYRDRVSLVLRLGLRSLDAVVDLSKKFGCAVEDAFPLLELGRKLGLKISGLSFHVGSQCGSPHGHVEAINECRLLIDRVRQARLTEISLLDIGGGFPASYATEAPSIETFCEPIRASLKSVPQNVRVVAEPGRYIAAPAIESIATVIGKARRADAFWYYLDDGVYGSFNGRVYDPDVRYPLRAITESSVKRQYSSVLAGPTCDSIDIVEQDIWLPELQIGDLIVGTSMGAYTIGSASEFNSLPKTKIVVLDGPPAAPARLGSD
jgi:ornithine decarboxylase